MKKANRKIIDNWNEISDSDWYNSYRTDNVISAIIQNPAGVFHPNTFKLLKEHLGGFKGKHILVPSSGDNHAVFAFHLLGAKVTSSDISQRQIENAQSIADKYKWDIAFFVENTMTLETFTDNTYDLVYTSNGVFVWIDDLMSMFENIHRVLKNGGVYITFDIHPFTRPFTYSDPADEAKITIRKPYDHTDLGIEKHWRMQDLLNAIVKSKLLIEHIEEMYPEFGTYWFESTGGREKLTEVQLKNLYDWRENPLAAIPAWLTTISKKD